MNKKIVSVLTALLIVTMAVPVFADNHMEDNVKVTGEVKTIFETSNYGDEEDAAAHLYKDDDVLDDPDPQDYPAEKRFYQEIGFDVKGMVNDNITFDLALDTLYNQFTEQKVADSSLVGPESTNSDLKMDTATLTISDDVSTLKFGDIGGFHADYTFINDEDREGMTLDTKAMGADVSAFVLGDNDANDDDFYGVMATKDLETAKVTGKVLHASKFDHDKGTLNVTNLVAAVEADLTDMVAVNGKVVSNSWEDDNSNADDSDTFMSAGMTAEVSDALTVNAKTEMVGEKYAAVADDTEGYDRDLYKVDAEYALDDNNTVTGAYTLVASGRAGEDEDKTTIEASVENIMGAYTNTASIAMTTNDGYSEDTDLRVIKLGTEYAMDAATLTADLTNQSADDDHDFTYLTVGLDQQITDNVNWNTSFGYITGTTDGDVDADANDFETSLTVNF